MSSVRSMSWRQDMPRWPVEEGCGRAVRPSTNPPKRRLRGLPLLSAVGNSSFQASEDVKGLKLVSRRYQATMHKETCTRGGHCFDRTRRIRAFICASREMWRGRGAVGMSAAEH